MKNLNYTQRSVLWSTERCLQHVWATPKAPAAPLCNLWSFPAVLQLLNGFTLESVVGKPWKNRRRFSSDKTGKPSPTVRDSRALALRCPCPAARDGNGTHFIYLQPQLKCEIITVFLQEVFRWRFWGKHLVFCWQSCTKDTGKNFPELTGGVATGWGAVHGLGTSSGKHFVEVNNPNELTRTALMCEVKYMPACRMRGFMYLYLVSLKI